MDCTYSITRFAFFLQVSITMKVISGVYPGVTTTELDTLAAETAACMTTKHPDYAILAARIAVSNLHKETKKTFSGQSVFFLKFDVGGAELIRDTSLSFRWFWLDTCLLLCRYFRKVVALCLQISNPSKILLSNLRHSDTKKRAFASTPA